MARISLVVLAQLYLLQMCESRGIYSHLEVHKEAYVKQISGHRVRRTIADDVQAFPKTVAYLVETDEGYFRLNLKRTQRPDPSGVMYITRENETSLYEPPKKPLYAFYVGIDTFASVVMNCNGLIRPCPIFGEYRDGGELFLIETESTVLHAHRKMKHNIYKVKPRQNMNGTDYVEVDAKVDPGRNTINDPKRPNMDRLPSGRRFKRDTGPLVIESLWHIENNLYRHWLDNAGGIEELALLTMDMYYHHLAVTITHIYSGFQDKEYIIFPILDVAMVNESFIIQNLYYDNGEQGLHASNTLDDYTTYILTADYYKQYDQYSLLTKFEMGSGGWFNTLGIAWWSRESSLMCGNYATLVVAAFVDGVEALTIAHELAHNLGVDHDKGKCNAYYVMSDYYGSFPSWSDDRIFQFSDCSLSALSKSTTSFISGETGYDCLGTHTSYTASGFESMSDMAFLGSDMGIDEQCETYFGLGSFSHLTDEEQANIENICYNGINCVNEYDQLEKIFVLPGTSCGTDKWCHYGECVSIDGSDPPTTTLSPTTKRPKGPKNKGRK